MNMKKRRKFYCDKCGDEHFIDQKHVEDYLVN